jgi:hypothetical protein
MMEEAQDRADAEHLQAAQAAVAPGPVVGAILDRLHPLPQDGEAQRGHAEPGDQVQILQPIMVSGEAELVAVAFADAVNGAFDTAPEFQFARHHRP